MGWPYHFIDLTEEQKHLRRERLDQYASLAQFSALIPLACIQVSFLFSWWKVKQRRRELDDAPGSPRRKGESAGRGKDGWEGFARRAAWWGGEPFGFGEAYFGRRGEVVAAVGWAGWLGVCCVVGTGDDYLHLTKRFGIVAASQLPLHYLLAMKSPYSPIQILTRCSHETLNTFHQLLGRVIMAFLYLHAIFYINFYIQKDLLAAKITEFYVICGILGIVSFTVIGTTALAPVRRWNYRVFYLAHVVLAAAIWPILFWHVTHIRIYLYETMVMYGLNAILRYWNSTSRSGSLKLVPDTDLAEISFRSTDIRLDSGQEFGFPVPKAELLRWLPGQHAYLSLEDSAASRFLRSNPFSVASVPTADGQIRFVARILDGNTTAFKSNAPSSTQGRNLTWNLEGPYGLSNHVDKLLECDRVLFVAGGVGGTFIAPLYRQLLFDLSPSRGSYRRQKVSFLWVARTMADVAWAVPEDSKERDGFHERLKIYLTGLGVDGSLTHDGFEEEEEDAKPAYAEMEEGIELEERKNLLSESSNGSVRKAGPLVYSGRPDLKRVVERVFSHGGSEKVAVYVCGPTSLSRSLRREVGSWVATGRDVRYWEEVFAM